VVVVQALADYRHFPKPPSPLPPSLAR